MLKREDQLSFSWRIQKNTDVFLYTAFTCLGFQNTRWPVAPHVQSLTSTRNADEFMTTRRKSIRRMCRKWRSGRRPYAPRSKAVCSSHRSVLWGAVAYKRNDQYPLTDIEKWTLRPAAQDLSCNQRRANPYTDVANERINLPYLRSGKMRIVSTPILYPFLPMFSSEHQTLWTYSE